MLGHAAYTVAFIFCIILAIAAVAALFMFLRNVTEKENSEKQWYRYVVPTLVAILLSLFFHSHRMGGLWQWLYFILIAVGVPVALSFALIRDPLEKRTDRVLVIVALLLLLNVAVFTAMWSQHYRVTHAVAGGGDNNNGNNNKNDGDDEENPHLSKRNWFLLPLWVLTALVGIAAGVMHKRNGTIEANEAEKKKSFLPW